MKRLRNLLPLRWKKQPSRSSAFMGTLKKKREKQKRRFPPKRKMKNEKTASIPAGLIIKKNVSFMSVCLYVRARSAGEVACSAGSCDSFSRYVGQSVRGSCVFCCLLGWNNPISCLHCCSFFPSSPLSLLSPFSLLSSACGEPYKKSRHNSPQLEKNGPTALKKKKQTKKTFLNK